MGWTMPALVLRSGERRVKVRPVVAVVKECDELLGNDAYELRSKNSPKDQDEERSTRPSPSHQRRHDGATAPRRMPGPRPEHQGTIFQNKGMASRSSEGRNTVDICRIHGCRYYPTRQFRSPLPSTGSRTPKEGSTPCSRHFVWRPARLSPVR